MRRTKATTLAVAVTVAAGLVGPTAVATQPRQPRPIPRGGTLPTPVLEPQIHRVTSAADLQAILTSDFQGQVVIPAGAELDMSPFSLIPIRSNVSLIGERGLLGHRPIVLTRTKAFEKNGGTWKPVDVLPPYPPLGLPLPARFEGFLLFEVQGNDVRIEGIHFRGSDGGDRDGRSPDLYAINVLQIPDTKAETGPKELGRRVVIADNEFDAWTGSGVRVVNLLAYEAGVATKGYFDDGLKQDPDFLHFGPDEDLLRVERNYFHHNANLDDGYGVNVAAGAFATIEGNVFDFNRHAVSANGRSVGYVARHNYVLQGGFTYGDNGYYGQHFDMHGSDSDGNGGSAGQSVRIEENTIRGEQNYGGLVGINRKVRPAFELRGRTANGAVFQGNIVVHDDEREAIRLKGLRPPADPADFNSVYNLQVSANVYDTDPSMELAVGNFDGDRLADVFVATGTAWFFSRGGIRPWEYLQWSRFRTGELGFADIDNDGRTDVLWQLSDGAIEYSSGGKGYPAPLTSAPVPMKDLRFGDFDGDAKTDVFYTLGGQWHLWYGSTRAWTPTLGAGLPVAALLFGEFDGTRGTDIVAALPDDWAVSSGSTVGWVKLNDRLRDTLEGAVAADFDGNGISDIAFSDGKVWRFSRDGRDPLAVLRDGSGERDFPPLHEQLVGRFGLAPRAQVVTFERKMVTLLDVPGERLVVWRGLGTGNAYVTHSEQNMR
jgi:hypothetical protein